MAWSDAARAAALEVRRRKHRAAQGSQKMKAQVARRRFAKARSLRSARKEFLRPEFRDGGMTATAKLRNKNIRAMARDIVAGRYKTS